MNRSTLLNIVIILITAILGVLTYKLTPLLRPNADLSLPPQYCNPSLATCSALLPNGGQLEFSVDPRPIRPLQILNLEVSLADLKASKVEIDFDGTQMRMGYNRPLLTKNNDRFTGQTRLPVCITGSMEWAATVLITTEHRIIAVPFRFDVIAR